MNYKQYIKQIKNAVTKKYQKDMEVLDRALAIAGEMSSEDAAVAAVKEGILKAPKKAGRRRARRTTGLSAAVREAVASLGSKEFTIKDVCNVLDTKLKGTKYNRTSVSVILKQLSVGSAKTPKSIELVKKGNIKNPSVYKAAK